MVKIIGVGALTFAIFMVWCLFALNCVARNAVLSESPSRRELWQMRFLTCCPSRAIFSFYYETEDPWFGDRYVYIWKMKTGEVVVTK